MKCNFSKTEVVRLYMSCGLRYVDEIWFADRFRPHAVSDVNKIAQPEVVLTTATAILKINMTSIQYYTAGRNAR